MTDRVSYAQDVGAVGAQAGTTSAFPKVSLTPRGPEWAELVLARAAQRRGDSQAEQFRRELGLPAQGRPVIMSGHQAQWWHAGILAKQIALAAVCRRTEAAPAWVVVDQDASDSFAVSYPAAPRSVDLPSRGRWTLAPDALAAHVRADVALGDLPAFQPVSPPTDAATPDIARGLRAIADCTARWSRSPNAAEQIARANAELTGSVLGQPPALLFATALFRTTAGRALLEKMADDPVACVAAYNQAVAEAGVGTIAPLSFVPDKGRYELPIWQLSGKGKPSPRRRVFAATLGDAPLDSLAPRGILMTALLRWLGCDLFIHGLGGGATGDDKGYDKVAERWFSLWLGAELAPSVVATATAHLPMGPATATLSEDDLSTAHRRIEDARHAPRTLGDAAAQREKDGLVSRIAATADRHERHSLYRQLQQGLEAYRTAHAADLRSAMDAATRTADELARQAILRERTWPWPLLPRTMILDLQRRVQAQLDP